ncbi:hypothetical protein BR93DRAFT_921792 [Coniochaeta sp. PMI_546]|nr:hypothetical protein BR93DRAFT_921792 [Coniochaeta sp. PMI_546]
MRRKEWLGIGCDRTEDKERQVRERFKNRALAKLDAELLFIQAREPEASGYDENQGR